MSKLHDQHFFCQAKPPRLSKRANPQKVKHPLTDQSPANDTLTTLSGVDGQFSGNKAASIITENVCQECRKLRSNRFGLVMKIRGQTLFVCKSCCVYLYNEGHGYTRSDIEFFLSECGPRGGAA